MSMLISLLALAVAAPSSRPPADSPVARHGRMRVKGSAIVGDDGKPVSVAGVSHFWSQWMPQFYNADAVRWLRKDFRAGIIRVAVAVEHGGYLEHPEAETKRATTTIDAAIAQGMYAVIDWHDHHADRHETEAIGFFTAMAKRYGKTPNVVYELWNEPEEIGWAKTVKPYHERVVAAIRRVDPDNLVILGSPTWSQDVDVAAADPVRDANAAYTLHFYAATHKQSLRDKAEVAMKRGVALFVTEWGDCEASGNGPIDRESTEAWMAFLRKHRLSHLNWSIADKVETSAILRPGANPRGGWKASDLTESGRYVRGIVRGWGD